MYSQRTKISVGQFLELQSSQIVALLLQKHGINGYEIVHRDVALGDLVAVLNATSEENIRSLLGEVAGTQGDLRNRVSPRYRYDERFADLKACLMLDGFLLDRRELVALDPSIMEGATVEDDLTRELNSCGLPGAETVIRKLEESAQAFRGSPPNLNACLNDARVAIQTLATIIAQKWSSLHPGPFDATKWGSIITYLKTTGFLTDEEEKGLVGVFGFVSPGSHRPLGLSDEEFARLGRSFVAGMCWFLVKRYRALHNP